MTKGGMTRTFEAVYPPPLAGFVASYLRCRTCSRVYVMHYQPYSIGRPMRWTKCGHGITERDLGCDTITEEQARALFHTTTQPREQGPMTSYFVIHESEDGTTSVEVLTEAELQEKLVKGWFGEDLRWVTLEQLQAHKNDNALPGNGTFLIVKGTVVIPKPEVVSRYEL